MQYLGSTVEAIAGEKAGILKRGVPVVFDANRPEVRAVIEKRAAGLSCGVYAVQKSWYNRTDMDGESLTMEIPDKALRLTVPFAAQYQACLLYTSGQLHMGHALDNTMQDILTRYKRMQGYEALWQPGTDHAAIATEVKVIDKLKSEGIDKNDLGREGFLEKAWEWKEEYGSRIVKQLHKLGSCLLYTSRCV